jgi:hypothetical protein
MDYLDTYLTLAKMIMKLTAKKLLLVDSLGALVSALLLGLVLVQFESDFGMPSKVLYFLSIIACLFSAYSLMSYLLVKNNGKPFLTFIALANLIYCCLTIGLTIYFHKELTYLGFIYFFSEVVIIITLAIIELKTVSEIVENKLPS